MSFNEYYNYKNILFEDEKSFFKTKKGADMVICSHLKLVLAISKKYIKINTSRISYHDIVQEGIIGLYKAINKFNPEKNIRFSSFAKPYILNSIRAYLRKNANLFFVPQKTVWQSYKIKKYIYNNPNSSYSEILNFSKVSSSCFNEIFALIKSKYFVNIDRYFSDINIDKQKNKTVYKMKTLSRSILKLSKMDKKILKMRYIYNYSWRQIGIEMSISHECARKKHNKIINILKENN